MKNLFIFVIIIALAYFAYQSFNTAVTQSGIQEVETSEQKDSLDDLRKDIPPGQQGAIIDLNNKIKKTISNTRNVVEKVESRSAEISE